MRAAVYTRYGRADAVAVAEVETPSPEPGEVLLAVRAAALNAFDAHLMRGEPRVARLALGLRRSKWRPGVDVAGVVEAVGAGVTRFKRGDAVFGSCRGALAEYTCAPESALALKPESVSFAEAGGVVVGSHTALQGLRKGRLRAGQKVLVNGAAGGVGTFAVQIAKSYGAEVTGVCSTPNLEMVRSIGADGVIDYTREDFTTRPELYDVIFDLVGNHRLSACRRVMTPDGAFVAAGLGGSDGRGLGKNLRRLLGDMATAPFVSQRVVMHMARRDEADLAEVRELMQAGRVRTVIDRCYPLDEAPEAFRYLCEGHARGKVVVTAP